MDDHTDRATSTIPISRTLSPINPTVSPQPIRSKPFAAPPPATLREQR